MQEFCGFITQSMDSGEAERRTKAMLGGLEIAPHHKSLIIEHGDAVLGIGSASDTAKEDDCAVTLEGFSVFGTTEIWNADRLPSGDGYPSDLSRMHKYLRNGGDLGLVSADFALGSYDHASRRLELFRDQIGMRSIFYGEAAHGVVFASNPRLLLNAGLGDTSPDPLSIASYLVMRHPGVGRFYLHNIKELPPAHKLVVIDGSIKAVQRYWRISETPDHGYRSEADCIEHVRERLVHSVSARLKQASRPGLFLSGGLDSSTIAGVAASLDPTREIMAFAHRPGPHAIVDSYDDEPFPRIVADAWPNIRLQDVTSHDRALLQGAEDWDSRAAIPCAEPLYAGGKAMEDAAINAGVDVILDGLMGDMAMSSDGNPILFEALKTGRFGLAAQEWSRHRKARGLSWKKRI